MNKISTDFVRDKLAGIQDQPLDFIEMKDTQPEPKSEDSGLVALATSDSLTGVWLRQADVLPIKFSPDGFKM